MKKLEAESSLKNLFPLLLGMLITDIVFSKVIAADKTMETIKQNTLPDLTTFALFTTSVVLLLLLIAFILFAYLYRRVCRLEELCDKADKNEENGQPGGGGQATELQQTNAQIFGKYFSVFLVGVGVAAIMFSIEKRWLTILINGINMFPESMGTERYIMNVQALNISWVTILGYCILFYIYIRKSLLTIRKIEKKIQEIGIGVRF